MLLHTEKADRTDTRDLAILSRAASYLIGLRNTTDIFQRTPISYLFSLAAVSSLRVPLMSNQGNPESKPFTDWTNT